MTEQVNLYDLSLVEEDDILFMSYMDGLLDLGEAKWRTCVVKKVLVGRLIVTAVDMQGIEQGKSFVVDANQPEDIDKTRTKRYVERMIFKSNNEVVKIHHLLPTINVPYKTGETIGHPIHVPKALQEQLDKTWELSDQPPSSPPPRVLDEGELSEEAKRAQRLAHREWQQTCNPKEPVETPEEELQRAAKMREEVEEIERRNQTAFEVRQLSKRVDTLMASITGWGIASIMASIAIFVGYFWGPL